MASDPFTRERVWHSLEPEGERLELTAMGSGVGMTSGCSAHLPPPCSSLGLPLEEATVDIFMRVKINSDSVSSDPEEPSFSSSRQKPMIHSQLVLGFTGKLIIMVFS